MEMEEILAKVASGEIEKNIDEAISTIVNQGAMISLLKANVQETGRNFFGGLLNNEEAIKRLDDTLEALVKTMEFLKVLKEVVVSLKSMTASMGGMMNFFKK